MCVSWKNSLLRWSDISFIITLVFMTYLCVFKGVSSMCVCVCVCVWGSGHVQTSPVSGQNYWLRGRTLSYCIVKVQKQTDRHADRQTILRSYKTLPPCQRSSWHPSKVFLGFRVDVYPDSRQVDICLFCLLMLRCKHQTVRLVPAASWAGWA